jgi:Flp pilus assembly protein TadD
MMAIDQPLASLETLFNQGVQHLHAGRPEAAIAIFEIALQQAPEAAAVHANLGLAWEQVGDVAAAEVHHRKSISLRQASDVFHLNYGAMLARQKRFADAEHEYKAALSINPGAAVAWSNLGVLLAQLRRNVEAEHCFRTALIFARDHANAKFNLGCLLLGQGRYEEGWPCLESRKWYAGLEQQLRLPRWQGESLQGKSILIGCEAGHGDMIQFCRYALLLRQRGAHRVSILCHAPLKGLLETMPDLDEVIALGAPIPGSNYDYWVPPLSLPGLFQTRLDTIPTEIPYLFAHQKKYAEWQDVLAREPGVLGVGLVWKGNPHFDSDADRSLHSLTDLADLGEVAGVRFYSLQKGAGEDDMTPESLSIIRLDGKIQDFTDTAAIMMQLDLVIAVDTAAAHLAGALGRPCWLLLPEYNTDWRWMTQRIDTPWYPGRMRLFRQPAIGDWATVIAMIKTELEHWVHDMRIRSDGFRGAIPQDTN